MRDTEGCERVALEVALRSPVRVCPRKSPQGVLAMLGLWSGSGGRGARPTARLASFQAPFDAGALLKRQNTSHLSRLWVYAPISPMSVI